LGEHLRPHGDRAVDGQVHKLAGSDAGGHVIFIEGRHGWGHGVDVVYAKRQSAGDCLWFLRHARLRTFRPVPTRTTHVPAMWS
jgi:hypothetical protein